MVHLAVLSVEADLLGIKTTTESTANQDLILDHIRSDVTHLLVQEAEVAVGAEGIKMTVIKDIGNFLNFKLI